MDFYPPIEDSPWAFQDDQLNPLATGDDDQQGQGYPSGFVPPPPPTPPSFPIKTLLDRDPLQGGALKNDARLRRFTEVLSSIFNSLIGQGQITQTGPASWQLTAEPNSALLVAISKSTPFPDGTYTTGIGPIRNGTITILNGIVVNVTQAQ